MGRMGQARSSGDPYRGGDQDDGSSHGGGCTDASAGAGLNTDADAEEVAEAGSSDGVAVAGTARWRRVFAGQEEQVGAVRTFVRERLGDHACAHDVMLVVSELATNACKHTVSGRPGGTFGVVLERRADGTVCVAVTDSGGPAAFRPARRPGVVMESGRGLAIVAAFSLDWSVAGDACGRTVSAEFKP